MSSFLDSIDRGDSTSTIPDDLSHADSEYSMDFNGAERIVIIQIDYQQKSKGQKEIHITQVEIISRIITLLSQLPKEGEEMIRMGSGVVHTVTAYKNGQPFAHVEMYGSMLKAENTAFYDGADEETKMREQELFELVRIQ